MSDETTWKLNENPDGVSFSASPGSGRWEVGYPDEFIGIYTGSTEQEVIFACRSDIIESGIKIPGEVRAKGLLARCIPNVK